jgi:hypothetical protein
VIVIILLRFTEHIKFGTEAKRREMTGPSIEV